MQLSVKELKICEAKKMCQHNTAFFYTMLMVHLVMILGKWPTWRTILFYVFSTILYMFRATPCSSSGESIVSIQHLVFV